MKKQVSLGTAILLLTGCATTANYTAANYEKELESWMGSPSSDLFREWGPPAQTFQAPNGLKMYTYIYNGGSRGTAGAIGNTMWLDSRQIYCKTTFTVDSSDAITDWGFEGNACRAYAPPELERQVAGQSGPAGERAELPSPKSSFVPQSSKRQ